MTANDIGSRARLRIPDASLPSSRVARSSWNRAGRLTTAAVFVLATLIGVGMGLAAPAESPVGPAPAPAQIAP